MRVRHLTAAGVLVAVTLLGCADPESTGERPTTVSSPTTTVPQPPSLTFTARERAPRQFALDDALACLRAAGLTPEDRQPFDPTVSGPAWRQCRPELTELLEVTAGGSEPFDSMVARNECMADQGYIDVLGSGGDDRNGYGQADAFCRGTAPSGASLLLCDAYRVAADGGTGPAPVRTDVEQFITVEATAPPTSTVGTPFVVTIRPTSLTMPSTLQGFTVVDGSAFVRAFTVEGGSIDPDSLRTAPPADTETSVSSESDGTTATFRYDRVVPATEPMEFGEATFEVVPSAPGRVTITFSAYEQSITFDVEGEQRIVRTVCSSRLGTPAAWSDAS